MIAVSSARNKYWEKILIECLKSVNITQSMEQSPFWKANSSSESQELPGVLLNPTVHCRIHKRPPPFPILSQISAVLASPFYVFKIRFNSFLTSTPMSSGSHFPSVRPTKFLFPIRGTYPAHLKKNIYIFIYLYSTHYSPCSPCHQYYKSVAPAIRK